MAKKKLFDHPTGIEREYTRLLLSYAKAVEADINALLIPHLDEIIAEYNLEMAMDSWSSTLDTVMGTVQRTAARQASFVFERLPGIYAAMSKFNERQFRMVVKANTGLSIPDALPTGSALGVQVFRTEPYLGKLARKWIATNTDLITGMTVEQLQKVRKVVGQGVVNGKSVAQLTKDLKPYIDEHFKNRCKLIAQDQINKGNADLTRYRLESVGVKEYIWRSVQDSRVRPEHQEYNGNQYSWGNPPPDGNPGQPVRCRCRAEAVWDEEVASAPPQDSEKREQTRKQVIWNAADDAWGKLNKTTDLAIVSKMQKTVSATLQSQGLAKATVNAQLNSWRNARLSLTPAKRAAPPAKTISSGPGVTTPSTSPKPPTAAPRVPADPFAPAPNVPMWGSETTSPEFKSWHSASFAGAPKAVRDTIRTAAQTGRVTYNTVENGHKVGAYSAFDRSTINMGGYNPSSGQLHGEAVWRHEFGHYLDSHWAQEWNFANRNQPGYSRKLYLSDTPEWTTARRSDSKKLITNDARREEALAAFFKQQAQLDASGDLLDREAWLAAHYRSLGMDYSSMKKLVREETYLEASLGGGMDFNMQNKYLRIANALEYGRAEAFLDLLSGTTRGATINKKTVAMLSDLIGSVTKNKLGGHRTGFGHSTAYYNRSSTASGTEAMANLLSLHGADTAKGWSQVLDKLTPALNQKFKKLIGYGRGA